MQIVLVLGETVLVCPPGYAPARLYRIFIGDKGLSPQALITRRH